ncbi:MAG: hypothetical protein V4532_13150 [Pseudomonadota bacterium]
MSSKSKYTLLRPVVCATAIVLMGLSGGARAQAQSLVDLYQAAKSYDAAYLAAINQAEAVKYKAAQA